MTTASQPDDLSAHRWLFTICRNVFLRSRERTSRSRLFRGRLLQDMVIEQARDAGVVPPAGRHADRGAR